MFLRGHPKLLSFARNSPNPHTGELGVAKSTLVEWSRKFRFEINNLRKDFPQPGL
jgi:hypothetical protein